jgi:hypothetical protein
MIAYRVDVSRSFTQRLGSETAVEVIGGADKYVAVCRHCYLTSAATTMAKDDAMLSTQPSKKEASSSQQAPSTPTHKRFAKRKSLNSPKKIASPAKRIAKRRRSQGNAA